MRRSLRNELRWMLRPPAVYLLPAFLLFDVLLAASVTYAYDMVIIALWSILSLGVSVAVVFAMTDREDAAPCVIMAVISFGISLLVAFYFRGHSELFLPDETSYVRYGREIAEQWRNGNVLGIFEYQHAIGTKNFGYYLYNAIHFLILDDKLLPIISNIAFKTLTGLMVFLTLKPGYGRRAALIGMSLILFNPFNIYWGSFDLKDTLLGFLLAVVMYLMDTARRGKVVGRAVGILVCLTVMMSIRFYAVFIVALLIGITVVLGRQLSRGRKAAILLIMLAGFALLQSKYVVFHEVSQVGAVEYFTSTIERSHEHLQNRDFAMSGMVHGMSLRSFVISFGHFILTPSPLNTGPRVVYMIPGTIVWYLIFPYFVIGTYSVVRESWKDKVLLYGFPWAVVIFYSFIPWLGSSRHRMMMMPFVAALTAVGFGHRFRHRKLFVLASYAAIVVSVIVVEFVIL